MMKAKIAQCNKTFGKCKNEKGVPKKYFGMDLIFRSVSKNDV